MRDSKPEPCPGRFSLPNLRGTVLQPESNKAFLLPVLQCTTARVVILGLSPFSAEPGALDECESRDPHAARKLHTEVERIPQKWQRGMARAHNGRIERTNGAQTIRGSKEIAQRIAIWDRNHTHVDRKKRE